MSQAEKESTELSVRSELAEGQLIQDRYKVLGLIGRGGIGSVYKVEQILLHKTYALKTLNTNVANEANWRRFQNEGLAASKLDHPNLVRAIDFGMIDNAHPYLVMDFVEGETLAEHLRKSARLPMDEALRIFIPICFAIAYAHQEGIIHRDIKPSNIVLAKDESGASTYIPKVVDFGIAKVAFGDSADQELTKTGEIFGTPLYMSPEQCAGAGVDHRSDIYSLGCVLFEALTGAPPFRAQTALGTMMQHGSAEVLSLKEASLGAKFPEALEKLVAKMLAKNCDDRYQSLLDVGNDLTLLLTGEVDRMHVLSSRQRVSGKIAHRPRWLTPAVAIGSGLVGVVLGSLATGIIMTSQKPIAKPQPEAVKPPITISALDIDFSDYFGPARVDHPEKVVFHFPVKENLGSMHWWQDGKLETVPVMGNQTLPGNARLIYAPYNVGLCSPGYWGEFRNYDLTGVIMSAGAKNYEFTEPAGLDFGIIAASQQSNLRWLSLETLHFTSRGFKAIGEIPTLQMLCLRDLFLTKRRYDDIQLGGEMISTFPNIKSLRTLSIRDMHNPTPLLLKLKNSNLKNLQLQTCDIDKKNLALICEIESLETLDLRKMYGVNSSELLQAASKLPNLKRLYVEADPAMLLDSGVIAAFPKLEILATNAPVERNAACRAALRAKMRVPSKFDWNKDLHYVKWRDDGPDYNIADDWFDPRRMDPDTLR